MHVYHDIMQGTWSIPAILYALYLAQSSGNLDRIAQALHGSVYIDIFIAETRAVLFLIAD